MNIAKYTIEMTKLQWNSFTTHFTQKFYKTNNFFLYEFDSITKNFNRKFSQGLLV